MTIVTIGPDHRFNGTRHVEGRVLTVTQETDTFILNSESFVLFSQIFTFLLRSSGLPSDLVVVAKVNIIPTIKPAKTDIIQYHKHLACAFHCPKITKKSPLIPHIFSGTTFL